MITFWQRQTLNKVEQCYQIAEQQLNRHFKRPEISFKLRGKSAGTAYLQTNKIRFNAQMLEVNEQAFIDEVVAHEICHLLCYQLFGRVKPHGKEWRSLMISLYQLPPKTTHNFEVVNKARAEFDYQCRCGVIKLSVIRHNKVTRKQAQYRCRRCLSTLKLAQ